MKRIVYGEYIKSPEWAEQRRSALFFARNRCQLCNSSHRLEVHHRTYERLGDERPEDLTVLCATCHERFHHRLPAPPGTAQPLPLDSRAKGAESKILRLMLEGPEWVGRAAETVSPDDFSDPHHRAVFEALVVGQVPASDAAARRLEELASDADEITRPIEVFTDAVRCMRVSGLNRRIAAISEVSKAATGDDERRRIEVERKKLIDERRELDPPIGRPRSPGRIPP